MKLTKELPYSTVARLDVDIRSGDGRSTRLDLFLKLIRHSKMDSILAAGNAEVDFYRNVADFMPSPPIVRCYDAQTSEESGRSHIFLADLSSTHSQPIQNQAPSVEQSATAVAALARCHARWWNDLRLGVGIGKLMSRGDLDAFIAKLEANVSEFMLVFGGELSSHQISAYDLMLTRARTIWGRLTNRRGLTITHGDCHWWNFLFPDGPKSHVYIIDWHLWHIDLGARDLAFLLALGGFAEPRSEIESSLLIEYHETLIEDGVLDYGFEELEMDYRWSAIRNLNIPVIFWKQGKHESTVRTTFRRAYESFERLDCRELIA